MVDANGFLETGRQARQAATGDQWTPFEDRVMIFLNNVRMLIRYVWPSSLPLHLRHPMLTHFPPQKCSRLKLNTLLVSFMRWYKEVEP